MEEKSGKAVGGGGRPPAVAADAIPAAWEWVIACTGAMLTVRHEAPFRISALACLVNPAITLAKRGTLDKFLVLATRRRRS